MREGVEHLLVHGVGPGLRDQVDKGFGVRGRPEDCAFFDEPCAEVELVREVPVVGERELAVLIPGRDRLNVGGVVSTRRRVPHVPDSRVPAQSADRVRAEDLRYEACPLVDTRPIVVEGDDPSGFLAAVLKGVHREVRLLSRMLDPTHTDNAALLAGTIIEVVPRRFLRGHDGKRGAAAGRHVSADAGAFMIEGRAPKYAFDISSIGTSTEPSLTVTRNPSSALVTEPSR